MTGNRDRGLGRRASSWAGRRLEARSPSGADVENAPIDAAEAWKAVGLVNDWVKHAETKAAGTLAVLGVVGGLLYNLIKDQKTPSVWLAAFAVVCVTGVVAGAVSAVTSLWPRLSSTDPATSSLYFEHIARRHPTDSKAYVAEFRELMLSPERLLEQLAQQIWANARIAARKHRWASYAFVCLVVAIVGLCGVATRLGLVSIGAVGSGVA